MLLWFVGTSIASVWSVFRDPKFAYRWVIVGALVPMFSVAVVVAVLTAVMLLTIGKKVVRKKRKHQETAIHHIPMTAR